MAGPLAHLLVVSLEQAVAAPFCSARLAGAGARVIKVERAEGDFARGYDAVVHGESAYFVWLNRGKESIVLDIKQPEDNALLQRLIGRADVFAQNLAPGAAERCGLDSDTLRAGNPRLITCDISGYGERGPYRDMKAYIEVPVAQITRRCRATPELRHQPGARVSALNFRARAPIFDADSFDLCLADSPTGADLWILGMDGEVKMTAQIEAAA